MLYILSVLNNGQLIFGVCITMTCLLSAFGASGVCGGDRFTVFTNFTIAESDEAVDFTVSGAFCSKQCRDASVHEVFFLIRAALCADATHGLST